MSSPTTPLPSRPCPFCGESIKAEAKKCRYCGELLDPLLIRQADTQGSPGHFRCPYCQSNEPPMVKSRVSTTGWVLFVVLLIFCFPLCFIGLFNREDYRVCSDCGIKLG